jgi:hypothetical protein
MCTGARLTLRYSTKGCRGRRRGRAAQTVASIIGDDVDYDITTAFLFALIFSVTID